MKVDDKQRYLMITEAAYFLAQRRNFEPGHEHEDWLAAERQVDEMLKTLTQQPALEQMIESGRQSQSSRKAAVDTAVTRRTTTVAQSKGSSPKGKKALSEGRQTTESNQAPAMQASLISETKEQPKPAQKAATGKTKSQPKAVDEKAAPVKAKTATGGRKAATAKQSAAAGTIPSEAVPQPTSATGEQPEVNAKTPAKRTKRSTRPEPAMPMPVAASSQEASKPARKPRQKKSETATATKGDGRRRLKTTTV